MGYAMACVEVVASCSPHAGEIYRELVNAWAAPDVKGFYEQVMATLPEQDVEDWKGQFRNPELAFLPDPNKPFKDVLGVGASVENTEFNDAVLKALQGEESTPEATAAATVFGLVFAFIIAGFNREQDLERDIVRVLPTTEPPWLMSMVLYRSGLEYGGITPERLDRIYKVGKVKDKTVNFEEVMTQEPMSRLHRKVVEASKKASLKLHHDNKSLDAAWVWYQSRVVHATVEDLLEAEWDKGDYEVDLKNLQKLVKLCDDAIGYQKRLARPTR